MKAQRYFSPWNFRNNVEIAMPSDIITDTDNYDSPNTLDVSYFNMDTEEEAMNNDDLILLGRNFTATTLSTCATANEAQKVVSAILQRVSHDTSYLVLDINANITGVNLEMLSKDNFARVISYSTSTDTKYMLGRNINVFQMGNKSILTNEFNAAMIDKKLQGCICLVENLTYSGNNVFIDTSANISVGNFININRHIVYVFVIQYEKPINIDGFESVHIEGYNIMVNQDLKIHPIANKGGMYLLTDANTRSLITSKLNIPPYRDTIFQDSRDEALLPPLDMPVEDPRYKLVSDVPDGIWKNIITSLPPPSTNQKGTKNWFIDYIHMLKIFLTTMIDDDEYLSPYIKDIISVANVKKYWMTAMMHETVNAENNYEQLETIGDSFLGTMFYTYLIDTYPKITSHEFTNLKNEYMSTANQALFCQEMRLDGWIVSAFDLEENIYEDVFEAFSGAMYLASESVKKGLGGSMMLRFIEVLFKDRDLFANDVMLGNKVTIIDQYNKRLGKNLELLNTSEYVKNGNAYSVVKLTEKVINFFSDNGIDTAGMSSKPITGIGKTKKAAERDSNTQMYFYLKSFGVTLDWVKNYKEMKILTSNPETKKLWSMAKIKAIKSGYASITTSIHNKADQYSGMILIGVKDDGSKKNLATYQIKKTLAVNLVENDIALVQSLLKKYIYG